MPNDHGNQGNQTMTTYKLQSSPGLYAPGLVNWCKNGYAFEEDRDTLVNVLWETYSHALPKTIIHALLNGDIPVKVEDEAVLIEVPDA